MKKRGIWLMVGAILVFGINFMTLGNQAFTTNPVAQKIGTVIVLLAVAVFLIGLVDLIMGVVNKK